METLADTTESISLLSCVGDKLQRNQTGIYRVNCKSSLDRTNVFQHKLDQEVLQSIIEIVFRINFTSTLGFSLNQLEPNQNHFNPQFFQKYSSIWTENGNMISHHYAGTDSLQ